MTERSESDLLDLIYGAAVDPALWPLAIERYADELGGSSVWLSQLSVVDGDGGRPDDPMARIDPEWLLKYADYFATRNPLHHVDDPQAYLRQWKPIILTDEDWMPKAELIRTEFYNDFLRPQDIGSTVMIRVAVRGAEIATLNINRPIRSPRFGVDDKARAARFQSHMIRAFGLAQKLGATLRLGDDLAGVLDLSPYGLVLLDAAGRIRHLNRAANTLISEPGGLSAMGGRLTAHRADAARTLQALIARAAAAESRAGGSMALAAPGRRLPLSITIVPLQSPRWSVFHDGPTVLVCVTDLEAGVSLPEHRLRDLFALTGAESRLALALLEGASPKEAALRLGISANTAKVHLARVFAKTRVNRQSELIALMMRAVGVRLD